MQGIARLSAVAVLLICLPIAQGDAYGAAGGGSTAVVAFRPGIAVRGGGGSGSFVGTRGFVANRTISRLPSGTSRQHQFARTFQSRTSQMAFPWWWGGIWPGSPDGWWPENAYQPAQVQEPPPSHPQVIVISGDHKERLAAADTMPDYSYVPGCHAIANGYHCEVSDSAR
jgi:hypothetical protein